MNAFKLSAFSSGGVVEVDTRVLRRQSALAVAAVVTMAPALAVGVPSGLGPLFILTALPVGLPLCMRHQRQGFARACLVIGSGLLTWGVVGFILGMFLFIPAAMLLLTAALLDRRNRPGLKDRGVLGAFLVVGAILVVFLTRPAPDEPAPGSYQARLDSGSRLHQQNFAVQKNQLLEFGATTADGYESCQHFYLEVEFPEGLPDARRAELEKQIGMLPGVVEVERRAIEGC
ncbi:hypothetical protein [Streptomyces sp. NPDC102409]|uniref:hypothetical protein n=1 Tax=Streptomyces sp. NPDC102409 TaxID=3366172 RepID=UPI00381A04E0